MEMGPTNVLEKIKNLGLQWHGAGTVENSVLDELANLGGSSGWTRGVETGVGRTTLLFSHLCQQHTVFAIDAGGSLERVRTSPLLRPGVVEFVEGPTQKTMPGWMPKSPLDLVMLDGPHGYPFPELEYYFCYPHLRPGGVLVLDDIHIPTLAHMFRVLREDSMYRVHRVVATTAILIRTDHPTFDPTGDGWWEQGYNRRRHPEHPLPGPRWRMRAQKWVTRWMSPTVKSRIKRLINRGP